MFAQLVPGNHSESLTSQTLCGSRHCRRQSAPSAYVCFTSDSRLNLKWVPSVSSDVQASLAFLTRAHKTDGR